MPNVGQEAEADQQMREKAGAVTWSLIVLK